jgi:hypothetical protein
MSSSNSFNKATQGATAQTSEHWLWLQSRLESKVDDRASQELSQWFCEQLDSLESAYSDLVTACSTKKLAYSLLHQKRR